MTLESESQGVEPPFKSNLPDASCFPLFYSFSIDSDTKMDYLIQEIIKYHGPKAEKFTGGNNRPGSLLVLPCFRSIKRMTLHFQSVNI
jgi:hypothetical protein